METPPPPLTREEVAKALHDVAYQLGRGYDVEVIALIREPGQHVRPACWPPKASDRLTAAALRLAADLVHDGSPDSEAHDS